MSPDTLTVERADNGYVVCFGRSARLVAKTRRQALELVWEWMTEKDAGVEDVRMKVVRRQP